MLDERSVCTLLSFASVTMFPNVCLPPPCLFFQVPIDPGVPRLLPQVTMSRARQPPLVTGISPKEGAAWTKVTIRGENLGTGPADLIGNTFRTT